MYCLNTFRVVRYKTVTTDTVTTETNKTTAMIFFDRLIEKMFKLVSKITRKTKMKK